MRTTAGRQVIEPGEPDSPLAPVTREPMPVYVYGSIGSVTIVDEPPRAPHDGVCRCDTCRASHQVDLASQFI